MIKFVSDFSMPIYPLQRVFYPQNRPCTPKIVGTFYMQGYKVKEKTTIVPHCNPVKNLGGRPGLAGGWLFSPGPPFPSPNKFHRHNINEILLKVVLIIITLTITPAIFQLYHVYIYVKQVI